MLATAAIPGPTHGRYIVIETLIGAVVNLAMGLVAGLIISGGRPPEPLGGGGVLVDMVPETFMVAFMSVLIPTLLTRNRRRKGRLRSMAGPGGEAGWHLLLRAAATGLAATVVAIPILYLVLGAAPQAPWGRGAILMLQAGYAVLLSIAITPPALRVALREPFPRRAGVR